MADALMTTDTLTLDVSGARAVARVRRNTQIDSATGARRAVELAHHVAGLASRGVRELIFDVREGPAVAGPITTDALGRLLASCEKGAIRVAVLVGADAVQALQFKRLATTHAPARARVVRDEAEAEAWVSPAPMSRR